MTHELPVIFRICPLAHPDCSTMGNKALAVIAFFPTLPDDYHGHYLQCYAHIGQHGRASFDYYRLTKPASESDASALLRELRSIYETEPDPVKLRVFKRMTATHRRDFQNVAARYRESVKGESAWVQGRIMESAQ